MTAGLLHPALCRCPGWPCTVLKGRELSCEGSVFLAVLGASRVGIRGLWHTGLGVLWDSFSGVLWREGPVCLRLSVKEEGLASICPGEELLFPQSFSLPGAASVFAPGVRGRPAPHRLRTWKRPSPFPRIGSVDMSPPRWHQTGCVAAPGFFTRLCVAPALPRVLVSVSVL